ncbi:MAG: hypothetical protein GF334_04400 [Candidatus Altiarchaeales archaeon]|nr:hypothetical protein [Candidatus Altiarchaeales archaeon]
MRFNPFKKKNPKIKKITKEEAIQIRDKYRNESGDHTGYPLNQKDCPHVFGQLPGESSRYDVDDIAEFETILETETADWFSETVRVVSGESQK